jgi:imidazolonepropionase-like amidohydrolase
MTCRAFRVGGIFDPTTTELGPPTTIAVRDGRIEAIAGDAKGVALEDFSHAIAMPGLIDAHTHLSIQTPGAEREQVARPVEERVLRALRYAEAMLAEGVTAIRILGEPAWLDLHFRDAFATGLYRGPRIIAAGRIIAPSHAVVSLVDTPADGVAVVTRVRENIVRRVDWIKVYATPSSLLGDPTEPYYSRDEIESIVRTARRAGLPVAAHAHGGDAVDDLIAAGVQTIEHGRYLEERQLARMAANGVVLCSTVGIGVFSDQKRSGCRLAEALERSAQSVALALAAGVTVIPGTDAVHGRLRFELEALEHYGASRSEALRAATVTAGGIVAAGSGLGRLEAGCPADFALLDGHPLDGERLPSVSATCVGGRIVWRADEQIQEETAV